MAQRMTIYRIKYLVAENEPHFFDRKTMKFFGQRLRDFSVRKMQDGRYRISCPLKRPISRMEWGETIRYFNPATNTLEWE